MSWAEKCADKGPVTLEYAKSLVEKGRTASPDVVQRLVGMILRGDDFAENQPSKIESLDDDDAEGD